MVIDRQRRRLCGGAVALALLGTARPTAAQRGGDGRHGGHGGHGAHAGHGGHGGDGGTGALRSDGRASAPAGASRPAGHAKKPALAIGAAFASDGRLWVVGLDAAQGLVVRTSADAGRRWQARSLETGADRIAAEGESRPKLAFGPQGRAVIAYTEPLARPYTGRIRMLRSADGGRSWSQPFTVHRDEQLITHRFESIAFDAAGALHTVWVDKRDAEAARAAGRSYRGAAIYRNVSRDGGASFGPDLKLADHSCECCRIALAAAPGGGLVALWRHVFAPNERDHAFAPLAGDGGAAPVRATEDRWALDACPHHGPGLAAARGGGFHVVWFGEREGAPAVRYGRLGSDGRPQGPVRALPDEAAEHADVASAGARVAITWRSFDGSATRWRAWLSEDGGARFALRELGASGDDNDHPRLARRGHELFALWRTAKDLHVERLIA